MAWDRRFGVPIALLNGRVITTLSDAREVLLTVEPTARRENPRRIDEYDLRFRHGHHALNRRPGGLRFVRPDGHFLPHQGIQQRGFPRIGAPHQRHETRLEFIHELPFAIY